jgi:hypothetical protein
VLPPPQRKFTKRRARKTCLGVEALEDRTVPAVVTYTGLGNDPSSWNDGDNWDSMAVPSTSDDVVIDSNTSTSVLHVDSAVTVNSLLLDNSGLTLDLQYNLTAHTVEFDNGTIGGSANLGVDTAFTGAAAPCPAPAPARSAKTPP